MNKLNVICGVPRSGTSIMSILIKNAVGEDSFIGFKFPQERDPLKIIEGIENEEIREYYRKKLEENPQPKRDDNYKDLNPDGFEECRYTVQGIRWHKGFPDLTGKYCKIVSQGLEQSDPNYIGKIVYMVRDPHQVAKSQERLKRQVVDEANTKIHSPKMYVEVTCQAAKWIVNNNKQHDVLLVNYDDLISSPAETCKQVSEFLGVTLDPSYIKPELKRSTSEFFEHELFPYAEKIHGFLLKGDWESICDFSELKVQPYFRKKSPIICERLNKKVSNASCRNCLSNKIVRQNFKKEAVKHGIDWKSKPCMYLTLREESHTLQETIDDNHWVEIDISSPTYAEQAKNITKSIVASGKELLMGKKVMADSQTVKARKSICDGCSFRSKNKCRACGCNINIKTTLKKEVCPKGKW